MAFRFSLEAVLRLRRSQERLEWLRLSLLAAAMAQVSREILVVEGQQKDSRQRIATRLTSGIVATDLHWESTCEWYRAERRATLQKHLQELRKRHTEQLAAFVRVRQKREIIEKLRVRQFDAYEREAARREQLRLDESFLLYRHARYRE